MNPWFKFERRGGGSQFKFVKFGSCILYSVNELITSIALFFEIINQWRWIIWGVTVQISCTVCTVYCLHSHLYSVALGTREGAWQTLCLSNHGNYFSFLMGMFAKNDREYKTNLIFLWSLQILLQSIVSEIKVWFYQILQNSISK